MPTTERLACPHCTDVEQKIVTPVMLRVIATRPVESPQVYERDYLCKRCGYTATALYVLPRHEDDYLTDDELVNRAAYRRAAGDRLRALRATRTERRE